MYDASSDQNLKECPAIVKAPAVLFEHVKPTLSFLDVFRPQLVKCGDSNIGRPEFFTVRQASDVFRDARDTFPEPFLFSSKAQSDDDQVAQRNTFDRLAASPNKMSPSSPSRAIS